MVGKTNLSLFLNLEHIGLKNQVAIKYAKDERYCPIFSDKLPFYHWLEDFLSIIGIPMGSDPAPFFYTIMKVNG